ncbi:MAG TPA: Ig-like domain-containing protein [Polyangia bacterium]|nr:Ig-like domain-containing protein [Polyangia bacterium]
MQLFPGHCGPFEVVRWVPAGFAQNVPTNTPIDLYFSDYPDPDTLGTSSLLLTTGVFYHVGTYSADLIDKRVRFVTPGSLRPLLGYSINVTPTLRSLQGCATSAQQRTFETGAGPAPVPAGEPVPTFDAVLPVFARSCGGDGCHRASASTGPDAGAGACLPAPASGLSLCDAEAFDALVSVPARQESRFLRVAPRDSSRSYLLRKLLPASGFDPANAPPVPTTLGHRDPPGAVLPPEDLRLIADWIDGGAIRSAPPAPSPQ